MEKVKIKNRRTRIFGLFATIAMAIGIGVALAPREAVKASAEEALYYTTSFGTVDGFTTSTTYNAPRLNQGNAPYQWDFINGTVSGTNAVTNPSAHLRGYAGAQEPRLETVFRVPNITKVVFAYKSDANISVNLSYSTDNRSTWSATTNFARASSDTTVTYTINAGGLGPSTETNIRWQMVNAGTDTGAKAELAIDDIFIYHIPPAQSFGELKSIAIKTEPTTSFLTGETFSSEGLVLTATDKSTPAETKDVTSGYATDFDTTTFGLQHVGTHQVEVSYQDVEDGPIAYAYYNITVSKAPHYQTGFESAEGFTASGTYNNTTVAYTGQEGKQWGTYYGTPSTQSPISGSQSLQMRWYTSATANLGYTFTNFDIDGASKIEFKAKQTNSLKVRVDYSTNSGSDWIEGQVFSPTTSGDEFTYDVPLTAQQSSKLRFKFQLVLPASNPSGTSNLYIDDVAISEAPEPVALSKIEITEQPTKKDYYVGDSFDPTDLEVTATYADSSTAVIDNSLLDFTPEHNLQLTDTSILVEFGGKEATISGISVTTRPTLSKIEVTQDPSKMVYKQFESFDKAGMEVTASYSNSTTEVVTNYTVSPETFEVIGASIPVTISYTFNGDTKSTTLYVEVTEIPVPTDIIANSKHTHATQNEKISIDVDDDLSGSVIDSSGYVESIVALSGNVYLGAKSHIQHDIQPLVIGASSGSGSIKLVLSDEISVSAITIYASRRTTGGNAATLKVNDLDVQTVGAAGVADDMFVDYVFEGVNSNEIVITSANNFATYIYGIDLEYTTYEEDALAFANEVMTGRGNFEQGTCHAVLADLDEMYDGLSAMAQEEFDTAPDQIFKDARARLDYLRAWVAANPELGGEDRISSPTSELSSMSATIIIGVIGLTTIAGYYFIQKKQEKSI